MTDERTAAVNALRALLRTSPDEADQRLARAKGSPSAATLTGLTRRRGRRHETLADSYRRREASRLAAQILRLDADLKVNTKDLTRLVKTAVDGLLDKTGVGPVSAAQVLVSWSHPGRCRNDAAFANLAGVSPIPASSGQTVRYRLNRGGDRQFNSALYIIADAA
jgi:transposase